VDTLLIDKAPFPRDKTCGDGLTPRAIRLLDGMGIDLDGFGQAWRISAADVVAPNGDSVRVDIPASPGWPDHIDVVPRLILDNLIRERAATAGAELRAPFHATSIHVGDDQVLLGCETAEARVDLRARVLILATGASTALLIRNRLLPATPAVALAARAYLMDCKEFTAADVLKFHFHRAALPGYGWVFPLSQSSVNIGVAIYSTRNREHGRSNSANHRQIFGTFLESASVKSYLGASYRFEGTLASYPIRMDFPRSPLSGERVLLVGEAAGLVNPLTGDGIDFALESGKLAASYLGSLLDRGDFSKIALSGYDRLLRRRYGTLFAFSRALQKLLRFPAAVDLLVREAASAPQLAEALATILLGSEGTNRLGRRLLRKVVAAG
jgi:flavin-dependent dehydrogenase